MIFVATVEFFSKNSPSFSLTNCVHGAGDIGIQLALGLSFELRLRQLHADHRDQAFAHVVAGQILFDVLEQAQLLPGVVDGAGQRRAEAGKVRAAVHRVDVVGEAENRFRVGVVVLQRHSPCGRRCDRASM